MTPRDFILIRHGQSESNAAFHRSKKNQDNSDYTEEFNKRHTSKVRLVAAGKDQARAAGKYLIENDLCKFVWCTTSPHIRAMETAGELNLPDAKWHIDIALRERELGDLEGLPYGKLCGKIEEMDKRKKSQFYWRPPGGESIADVYMRVEQFMRKITDMRTAGRVLAVSHGDAVWAFRMLLENMTISEWTELRASKDPKDRINNGQIIHYSSVNPNNGMAEPRLKWMRSICPTKPEWSRPEWKEIREPTRSNEELLEYVKKHPRLVEKGY